MRTLLLGLTAALLAPAAAQNLVITNAKIPDAPGKSAVLIAGGKVVQLAEGQPRIPGRLQKLDAQGATLVPGRIDAWAQVAGNSGLGSAVDGFDPYDTAFLRRAYSQGVTALCLTPDHAREGINGLAAVVRLLPDAEAEDRVLSDASALCAGLGVGEGALTRAQRWGELREAFAEAKRYREAWLDYEEELAEYVKTLPEPAAVDSGTKPAPKAKGKRGKPAKAAKDAKDAKKKDEAKAPKQPPHDRGKDAMVRVLAREIPLRLHVERASDVINALELAEAFDLRLVLEGGREAYLAARELVDADVAVVLGPAIPATVTGAQPDEYARGESAPRSGAGWHDLVPLRDREDAAATLDAAGVTVAVGSGSLERSPFVGLNAGLYAAGGLAPAQAEAAVTRAAAEVLGVGEELGQVAQGFRADLVLLDDAGTVLATVVGGQIVYRKDAP